MIARATLEKVGHEITEARDIATVLFYASKGAQSNEEELRDFAASADTVIAYLIRLIEKAHEPIHETLVLGRVISEGGAR